MTDEFLLDLHRRHAWQPFTQMKAAGDPLVIRRAEGSSLFTADGRRIIDAVGSWWVSVHGHNHPALVAAAKKQLDSLDHVMYAGFTHPAAAELSARLAQSTQGHLPRVFFSDNGSTAVEIGLKMAFQFFSNVGRPEKKSFVTLDNGYHGDTIGTMSVGARSVFHSMYDPLLFPAYRTAAPACPFGETHPQAVSAAVEPALERIRSLFEQKGREICGMILEPLIQGAGGMRMHPPEFLSGLRKLCDHFEIFLIADEVFTGCGRTGSLYAFQKAGVWPDILALSKGLSAGICAFAATLACDKVFQGFFSDDRTKTLFHGHSMTGSPLGCAVALASIELLENGALDQVRALEIDLAQRLRAVASGPLRPHIREVRWMGAVGVVEFNLSQDYLGSFGPRFAREAAGRGVLLRPLGPVVYLTPSYNISPDDLDLTFEVLEKSAQAVLG